jgi:hypothetical protein
MKSIGFFLLKPPRYIAMTTRMSSNILFNLSRSALSFTPKDCASSTVSKNEPCEMRAFISFKTSFLSACCLCSIVIPRIISFTVFSSLPSTSSTMPPKFSTPPRGFLRRLFCVKEPSFRHILFTSNSRTSELDGTAKNNNFVYSPKNLLFFISHLLGAPRLGLIPTFFTFPIAILGTLECCFCLS